MESRRHPLRQANAGYWTGAYVGGVKYEAMGGPVLLVSDEGNDIAIILGVLSCCPLSWGKDRLTAKNA